jgi:hypothetical protein
VSIARQDHRIGSTPVVARAAVAGVVLCTGAALVLARPAASTQASPGRIEVLQSVDALPAGIVGRFREPIGWQRDAEGRDFVFDRRGHTIYRIDGRQEARRLVEIGGEDGRVLEPGAFAVAPNGTFAVADAPGGRERVQIFNADGARLGGFTLPGRATARLSIGNLVLNGVGSLQYTGRGILMSQPETGSLITVYGLAGTPVRSIGRLRETGHEHDRELHLAFNSGLPLVDPTGGYYFVFLAGPPVIRKYDADGAFVWERLVQGRELDGYLRALPSAWPRRDERGREVPLVIPTVRTAAVDPAGRLWISLMVPVTYVIDAEGEKVRTVQFRAAGVVAPVSLHFAGPSHVLVTPGCYVFDTA